MVINLIVNFMSMGPLCVTVCVCKCTKCRYYGFEIFYEWDEKSCVSDSCVCFGRTFLCIYRHSVGNWCHKLVNLCFNYVCERLVDMSNHGTYKSACDKMVLLCSRQQISEAVQTLKLISSVSHTLSLPLIVCFSSFLSSW